MRVDYLAPGRGKYFIARAEVLRLGRKGCTMRMTMVNDEDKAIAAVLPHMPINLGILSI